MRIGIITQPLCSNYGGILQNLALQTVVKELGHTPITLDLCTHLNISKTGYLRYCLSALLKNILKGEKTKLLSYKQKRPSVFNEFISKYICTTQIISSYDESLVETYKLDCLLVGSDQVWRPRFNVYIEDMFFSFAEKKNLRRLSYAASFGVDDWEYSSELTNRCQKLISLFNGVSVREDSGVRLCDKYLHVKAEWVLDPTLLQDSSFYDNLCDNIKSNEMFIAVYALSLTSSVKQAVYSYAEDNHLKVKYFTADANFTLSIPEWIAVFRDASLILTDSFHGTLFSIIYKKNFITLVNNSRGTSRFHSILRHFGLLDRLMDADNLDFNTFSRSIDWGSVDKILEKSKEKSICFLRDAIQK